MKPPAPPCPRRAPLAFAKSLTVVASIAFAALAGHAAETAGQAPVSARPAASGEARLAPPPVRLELPAGATKGTAMGAAAADRPAVFLLAPPAGAMLSIGVSSKSGEARLSIYEPGAASAMAGTSEEVGAIRWIGTLGRPGDYRVVAHTKGAETPVRVEVTVEQPAGAE